jgi:hypothetical protein
MLKKELAELIASAKDDDSIDEIISKSDLGKVLVSSGSTLDSFKEKLKSDKDFKSFMDSEKDTHSTKSLKTWQDNNLKKLIDDEIKKRYPDKDPKDKALEDVQIELDKMKAENLRKDLTNKTLKSLTEKKLPQELADFIVGTDEDDTNKNLEALVGIFGKYDENLKSDILKETSYTPPLGGGSESKPGSFGLKLAEQNKTSSSADLNAARESYFK